MRVMRSLVIAFATYSRIPMPQVEWTDENRRYAMCFFPLIGAVIGLLTALGLWACDALRAGPLLRGAVGAALPLLATGGIHMDGFMDVCDAMAAWQTKARRLEILKDSHVGAFAVLGCGLYLLAFAGLMSEMTPAQAPLLGACFVLSRALSGLMMTVLPSARSGGMLDGFARAAQRRAVRCSAAAYAALCAAVWGAGGGWTALLCPGAAAACTVCYCRMCMKHFGGVTGDLAGWYVQVTELCLAAAVMIGGRL